MANSIRVRLLLWTALVQAGVLTLFGLLLYYELRTARIQEVDAQLSSAGVAIDIALRRFPPFELNPDLPRPEPAKNGPPKDGKEGKNPPPPLPRERLLADLVLPTGPNSPGDLYFAVWRADGTLVKSDRLPPDAPRPTGAGPRPTIDNRPGTREYIMRGPHSSIVLIGRSTGRIREELGQFLWLLAGGGIAALGVGVAGGWFVSGRIFRPITAIATTASHISGTNMSERIDTSRIDVELSGLARVLNGAFDRLQNALERQSAFTADASHELRTPLSILRSQAELALARPRNPDDYRAALNSCLQSAIRMTDLVERMLAVARADAGWPGFQKETFDLDAVVVSCLDELRPLAEVKKLKVLADLEPVQMHGDSSAIQQLVSNLISNAIRYNREEGSLRVHAMETSESIVLSVSDSGIGIPEEDRGFIFERFYRADKARSRAVGGSGLGLAICRAIVEAHGGRITFTSELGEGTTFRVTFPRHLDWDERDES